MALTHLSFDPTFYLTERPDVLAAYVNAGSQTGTGVTWDQFAEQHYNDFGWKEGYNPNAIFNTSEYLAANLDVLNAGVNPFQHYLAHGANEGRAPSDSFISLEDFDWETYLAANDDLTEAGIETAEQAYGHYVVYGQFEERDGKPAVSIPGEKYTLTRGLDEFPGTANDDIFQGEIRHLNGFDDLDGGAGNDVLNLHGNGNVAVPSTVTVANIETINIIGAGNGSVNASTFKGAKEVWQIGRAGDITGVAEGVTAGFRGSEGNNGGAAHIVTAAAAATSVSIALDEAGADPVAADSEFKFGVAGATVTTVNISGTVANDGKLSFADLPTTLKTINLALDSDSDVAAYAGAVTAFQSITTLNASESTGDLTVGLSNASLAGMKAEIISLGSGNDTVTVANANFAAKDVAIDLGAGHDKLVVNLSQNDKNNLTIATGEGEDVIVLTGGNVKVNSTTDGFDGSVSITDFSSASDTLLIENFNGFTAQNLINAAIATADSLYDAVVAVADIIVGGGTNITNFAKFVFDGDTYIYGDATATAGLDNDLLVSLTGVVDLNNDNVAFTA